MRILIKEVGGGQDERHGPPSALCLYIKHSSFTLTFQSSLQRYIFRKPEVCRLQCCHFYIYISYLQPSVRIVERLPTSIQPKAPQNHSDTTSVIHSYAQHITLRTHYPEIAIISLFMILCVRKLGRGRWLVHFMEGGWTKLMELYLVIG